MLFDNMLASIIEGLDVLIWIGPRLFRLLAFIITPIVTLGILGILVVVRGWKPTSEVLIDKWVDKGLEVHMFTMHNLRFATGVISFGVFVTLVLGVTLDLFIVGFTAYCAYLVFNIH